MGLVAFCPARIFSVRDSWRGLVHLLADFLNTPLPIMSFSYAFEQIITALTVAISVTKCRLLQKLF